MVYGLPWLDKTAVGGAKMVYGRDKMVYGLALA